MKGEGRSTILLFGSDEFPGCAELVIEGEDVISEILKNPKPLERFLLEFLDSDSAVSVTQKEGSKTEFIVTITPPQGSFPSFSFFEFIFF